jgi:hypothetical protein
MLQLDKYTNGTVLESVNDITIASGSYTFNFTEQTEYVYAGIGIDNDNSGWYTYGDCYAWYENNWDVKKAVKVSDGPVSISL